MDASFTLFPRLPPEIRLAIWHLFFTTSWSFTGFSHLEDASLVLSKPAVILLGRVARTAAASCREARAAMLRVYEPSAFGPVDFPRHLFYLRGPDMLILLMIKDQWRDDRERNAVARVLAQVGGMADVAARAQHVVLPMNSLGPEVADTIRMQLSVLRDKFISLRSLVIVSDRQMIAEHQRGRGSSSSSRLNAAVGEGDEQEGDEQEEEEEVGEDPWRPDDLRDGWLDWSSSNELFERSPREVDVSQLVQDLEGEHTASRALAMAKAWPESERRRLSEEMPLRDYGRWRGPGQPYAAVGEALALVKEAVSEMPSKPRLYLRMRHELPRFDEPELPSP